MKVDGWTTAMAASALAASQILPSQVPAFAPPPLSLDDFENRLRVDKVIRTYWQGKDGFTECDEDDEALTYGEMTTDGGRAIFHELFSSHKDAYFADLGSGVGKLAAQARLEYGLRALGVEISPERHRNAVEAWGMVVAGEEIEDPLLELRCDNCLETNLDGVTHAYCGNLCFPEQADSLLVDHLQSFSSIRKVAVLRQLPHLSLSKVVRARMTWNALGGGTDVYIYDV